MSYDISLPAAHRKARFRSLYSRVALHEAVLQVYTKPLFAWRKAYNRSHDDRTLYDFARHTPQNVDKLHKQLARETIRFREALPVHFNFNGKHRTVYIFPWEERILDRLLYQMLNRYFHSVFSPNCYAYRYRGFGLDPCQRSIAKRVRDRGERVYLLKRDIANYFPSVDHPLLIDMLRQWVDPHDFLFELLRQRVEFRVRHEDDVRVMKRGIPFGSPIACFFSNVYLTPLDRALSTLSRASYFRYADDLLVLSSSRDVALAAAGRIEDLFGHLKVQSKPSHNASFAFLPPGAKDNKFDSVAKFRHLGLEFRRDGSIGLSRDKSRKIRNLFRFAFRRERRKFRRHFDPLKRAKLAVTVAQRVIDNGVRSVSIIDYYLKHVDDEEQLRMLDRWLAEEVLALAFQNGHRRGNFRRLPFVRLREMGLPSLRHRRRLLRHGHLRSSFFRLRTERVLQREGRRLPGRKAFSPCLEAAAESKAREKEPPPVDRCH